MLALRTPQEAYRRVDFDARVAGADPQQLVVLCYEQVITALASALFAHESGNNHAKSQAITRALAAITALQLGVAGHKGIAASLQTLYASVRRALLDAALDFAPARIATIRQDLIEIAGALQRPATRIASAEPDS